jgi:hypothetical protein
LLKEEKMKIIKTLLLVFIITNGVNSQTNYFSVSTVRHSNWTYLQFNFNHEFKNKFEIGGGIGLNLTPVVREGHFKSNENLPYHPSPTNALELFTLNYRLKKYLNFEVENCKFYFSAGQTFAYSTFRYMGLINDNNTLIGVRITTAPNFYFIQQLNIGSQIQLKPNISLFSSVGINYLVNNGGKKANFIFEAGFNFHLKKKQE